jgi:hypothetical protein
MLRRPPSFPYFYESGFFWWNANQPSATPTYITLGGGIGGNGGPPIIVYYMGVDSSGNIWFDYGIQFGSNPYTYGLAEITSPTSDPILKPIEPRNFVGGVYENPGGVYVSSHGKTLNVVDSLRREIFQYHLPLSPSGAPFNVLGPTYTDVQGYGFPVEGGFNKKETQMALGDVYGWLDFGAVSSNGWTAVANPNFYAGLFGAAYTPSDK